jgi:hypothetical protein
MQENGINKAMVIRDNGRVVHVGRLKEKKPTFVIKILRF